MLKKILILNKKQKRFNVMHSILEEENQPINNDIKM